MSEKFQSFLLWLYLLSIIVGPVLCAIFKIPAEIMVLIGGIFFGLIFGLLISADSGSISEFLGILFLGILCGIIAYFNVVWGLV